MSSSKSLLKNVLTDLGPLSSFGMLFLAPNGEILYGSFTNEEYETLAVDIVKRSFSNMSISDFFQRGLSELNSKLYVFKIAKNVVISIITSETIGTVMVNLNTIIKKYHQQFESVFQNYETLREVVEEPTDLELHEIQDEVLYKIVERIFKKIKQLGTIEILFFEGDKFIFGSFVDKEYEKIANDMVRKHVSDFNVSDFVRKTVETDTKLYLCKLSETITTAFLAKNPLGQILLRLKEITEEFNSS